jgi:hypothetical protein
MGDAAAYVTASGVPSKLCSAPAQIPTSAGDSDHGSDHHCDADTAAAAARAAAAAALRLPPIRQASTPSSGAHGPTPGALQGTTGAPCLNRTTRASLAAGHPTDSNDRATTPGMMLTGCLGTGVHPAAPHIWSSTPGTVAPSRNPTWEGSALATCAATAAAASARMPGHTSGAVPGVTTGTAALATPVAAPVTASPRRHGTGRGDTGHEHDSGSSGEWKIGKDAREAAAAAAASALLSSPAKTPATGITGQCFSSSSRSPAISSSVCASVIQGLGSSNINSPVGTPEQEVHTSVSTATSSSAHEVSSFQSTPSPAAATDVLATSPRAGASAGEVPPSALLCVT